MALASTVYAFALSAPNFGFLGALLVLFSAILSPQVDSESIRPWMPVLGAMLAGLAAMAGESHMLWGRCPGLAFHRLRPAPYLLYGAAAWNTVWLADAFCAARLGEERGCQLGTLPPGLDLAAICERARPRLD